MKQSWTQGLDPSRATQIKQDYVGAATLRKRMEELLLQKIKVSNAVTRKKESYEISNWAYLQADAIGYERAILEIISLISENSVEK